MHVVVEKNSKAVKDKIREEMHEHGINHVTIETESVGEKCQEQKCELKSNDVHHHHHH